MSATCSSPAICPAFCLAAEGFEPGGGSERDHFTGLHGRQAGQDILEVVAGDYAKAAAVFHDGVEDGALQVGSLVAYSSPLCRPTATDWTGGSGGLAAGTKRLPGASGEPGTGGHLRAGTR